MNSDTPPAAAARHGLAYRPDIDGLRAVAVVPIVLFHAGIAALGGGFIGVDIFFVISGYLITRIISEEMAAGTFSIGGFYRRRIVRIFPALFVMLAAVLIAAILLMFPSEIRGVSRSAAAAAASGSNVLFWRETGYFAPAAETDPLLHTWSLAVEEQFYLFFPLFLLAVRHWCASLVNVLVWIMVAGSLAAGLALTVLSQNAAFYLLPGRIWELGLGAVVALGAVPAVRSALLREALTAAGALVIVVSYLVIRSDMPFPVPAALPVCIGTAVLIAYGEGSQVSAGLATGLLRFIGRISYSVYLWHWPIITFYRIEFGFELAPTETLGLVAASFLVGWISFALVEQRTLTQFRSAPVRPSIGIGLAAIGVTVAVCFVMIREADSLTRFAPEYQAIARFAEYKKSQPFAIQYGPKGCFVDQANKGIPEAQRQLRCEKLSGPGKKALLVGDSFGAQFARALPERFGAMDWSLAIASGCRPTISGEGTPRCRAIMERAYRDILQERRIDLLVIGGRWQEEDIPHVRPTLRRAAETGTPVVLLGPITQYDSSFPLLYARSLARWRDNVAERRDPHQQALEEKLREIAVEEGATFVSMLAIECPRRTCPLTSPSGAPLRWDYGHYTLEGARWMAGRLPDLEALAGRRVAGAAR